MDMQTRSEREPGTVTTLDLLLLIAGFACGMVLHQNSAFVAGRGAYILPSGSAGFRCLLGMTVTGWLWALGVGLAVLVVGRCFRYVRPICPAEWLTVVVTAVLLDSAFPAIRPNLVASMDEEVVWVHWSS